MTGGPKKRSEHEREREPDEYELGSASTERRLSNVRHTFKLKSYSSAGL
jgi:hypothetical protein